MNTQYTQKNGVKKCENHQIHWDRLNRFGYKYFDTIVLLKSNGFIISISLWRILPTTLLFSSSPSDVFVCFGVCCLFMVIFTVLVKCPLLFRASVTMSSSYLVFSGFVRRKDLHISVLFSCKFHLQLIAIKAATP